MGVNFQAGILDCFGKIKIEKGQIDEEGGGELFVNWFRM
jgi:hypothetical protein